MDQSPDIWLAFGRTFGMLFLVLALLIFFFYLAKRFSESRGLKGHKDFIRIMSVHHLSPKEKLVLMDVLGQTLLVGVTPNQISKIAELDQAPDQTPDQAISHAAEPPGKETGSSFQFSDFLARKLGSDSKGRDSRESPQ